MSDFHPRSVVVRGSETQLQVDENLAKLTCRCNGNCIVLLSVIAGRCNSLEIVSNYPSSYDQELYPSEQPGRTARPLSGEQHVYNMLCSMSYKPGFTTDYSVKLNDSNELANTMEYGGGFLYNLFSPGDVTAFNRIKHRGGGVM